MSSKTALPKTSDGVSNAYPLVIAAIWSGTGPEGAVGGVFAGVGLGVAATGVSLTSPTLARPKGCALDAIRWLCRVTPQPGARLRP